MFLIILKLLRVFFTSFNLRCKPTERFLFDLLGKIFTSNSLNCDIFQLSNYWSNITSFNFVYKLIQFQTKRNFLSRENEMLSGFCITNVDCSYDKMLRFDNLTSKKFFA